jgi:hypothetical protein
LAVTVVAAITNSCSSEPSSSSAASSSSLRFGGRFLTFCSLSSLLFLNHLNKHKKELVKIKKQIHVHKEAKLQQSLQALTCSCFSRASFFTKSLPVATQNSFKNLIFRVRTSSLARIVEVLAYWGIERDLHEILEDQHNQIQ